MTISDDVRAADSIAKIANEMAHYDWVMPPPIEIWAQRLRALPSLAELERDAAIGRLVRSKLVSGNDVPVERCLIYAKEIVPLAASPARVGEGEKDAARLYWFASGSGIDGIGDIDIHEEASINASAFGRDEPNKDDYLSAIRTAIDAAMSREAQ